MELIDIPLINSKDLKILSMKNKLLIISFRDIEAYLLDDLTLNIWKLINGKNNIGKIFSLIKKTKNIDKNELISIFKELEENGLISFKIDRSILRYKGERFYHYIKKWALEQKKPSIITFELTNKCNFNCIHCYLDKNHNRKKLSSDEIKKIIDEMEKLEIPMIGITGGEPFLRKDIIEILNYAANKNFLISIKTNGSLITEKICEQLKILPISQIEISVYGSNKKEYKIVTGNASGFDKTMNALSLLAKTDLNVTIAHMILKENFKNRNKIKKFAEKNNFGYANNKFIDPTEKGSFEPLEHMCSCSQYSKFPVFDIEPKLAKELLNLKRGLKENDPLCLAGRGSITINSYGDVLPCSVWRIVCENIRKKSLKDIWYNSKKLKWIRTLKFKKFKKCKKCDLLNYCALCTYKALDCKEWVKNEARIYKHVLEKIASKAKK